MPHYGGVIDPGDSNDPRTRIVNWVPPGDYVLEIGCGSGTIIGYLARVKACRALAVEPDPVMADEARALGVEVLQGSVASETVQAALAARGPFDVIVFADVLEHLRDPWQVLKVVREWLTPSGCVLVSLPNVAHWSVRFRLLLGRFDYTDGFLMDRTHLRFFTRASARQMFEQCGYTVEEEKVRWAPFPGDRLWRRVLPFRNALNAFLARAAPGLYGYQFLFKLRRKNEG